VSTHDTSFGSRLHGTALHAAVVGGDTVGFGLLAVELAVEMTKLAKANSPSSSLRLPPRGHVLRLSVVLRMRIGTAQTDAH
jgi:hypothetical protein